MEKKVKSINFDKYVLRYLEGRCKEEEVTVSSFVNRLVRGIVCDPKEFAKDQAKQHAMQLTRWQQEMRYLEGN